MQVRRCALSGKTIRSLDDLYDQLTKKLSFPDYFGRNLDALWDVLASDVEGPFEIVWKDAGASKKSMGKSFERAVNLLKELETERDDFTFKLE